MANQARLSRSFIFAGAPFLGKFSTLFRAQNLLIIPAIVVRDMPNLREITVCRRPYLNNDTTSVFVSGVSSFLSPTMTVYNTISAADHVIF